MESKMSIFSTHPQSLKKYEQKGVYFSKPRLVAFYDYNYGKVSNAKRMKYFRIPTSDEYPLDIEVDYKKYKVGNSSMNSASIEISLKYVMTSGAVSDDIENIDKTIVITQKRTLVQIMESYFNRNYNGFTVRVSRYNGNLYMVMDNCDESVEERTPIKTHHLRLQKFLFSDSPNTPPNPHESCDENIKLIGVNRSNFGKYDVIYSNKIYGIDSKDEIVDFNDLDALNDCRYVLCKQMWSTLKNKDNKYLKFWLQSYLGNVQDIYIGYKEDGIIYKPIEHYISKDLPKNRFWKPSICTGFLYEFLKTVEKQMSSVNSLNTVYMYNYNPKQFLFSCKVFNGKTEKTFISKEYMEYCKNYN